MDSNLQQQVWHIGSCSILFFYKFYVVGKSHEKLSIKQISSYRVMQAFK